MKDGCNNTESSSRITKGKNEILENEIDTTE